jgi:hypothetical protein
MQAYRGVEVYPHAFLTLVLDGSELLASRYGHLNAGEETRFQLDRRLGGPQNLFG